jgi:hypothetical protein
MDIYCAYCKEPWEYWWNDEKEKEEIHRILKGGGCPACNWGTDETKKVEGAEFRKEVHETIVTMLGDDTDGAVSLLEDFGG